jgi:hypothetical protein
MTAKANRTYAVVTKNKGAGGLLGDKGIRKIQNLILSSPPLPISHSRALLIAV